MKLSDIKKLLPDALYLKLQYKRRFGKRLNLANPTSFNEKIQWLKIHDRKPEYTIMVDKVAAKNYVSEIIGKEHIVPTIGVWERFEDIDFDVLPKKFVLKCNHDSGGLIVVRDKDTLDKEKAKTVLNNCLKRNYYYGSREWPYKMVKPLIFAEEYLESGENGLIDYKFFNFNGVSKFLYISEGLEDHSTAKISFFDFNGKQLPFKRSDFKPFQGDYCLPENFSEMHRLSDILAKGINAPFVRTDFYSINGKVYFSEITFSPCGGMVPFEPISADEELGKLIKLPIEGNN